MAYQIPKVSEFYDLAKDKKCQIIAVAPHTETKETMVVYQELYDVFGVYVSPLPIFLEKINLKKELEKEVKKEVKKEIKKIEDTFVAKNAGESYMIKFLDAKTYKERIEILDMIKPYCTESILQNFAVSLDMNLSGNELEEQFIEFRKALALRMKYEAGRLRE